MKNVLKRILRLFNFNGKIPSKEDWATVKKPQHRPWLRPKKGRS